MCADCGLDLLWQPYRGPFYSHPYDKITAIHTKNEFVCGSCAYRRLNERNRLRREHAKKTGKCLMNKCSNPVIRPGHIYCREHYNHYRENARKRLYKRREQGLCIMGSKYEGCLEPLAPTSRNYCQKHLDARNEQQRARRQKARLIGATEFG